MFRIATRSRILVAITGRPMVEYWRSCAEMRTIPTVSQMKCFVGISASLCLPIWRGLVSPSSSTTFPPRHWYGERNPPRPNSGLSAWNWSCFLGYKESRKRTTMNPSNKLLQASPPWHPPRAAVPRHDRPPSVLPWCPSLPLLLMSSCLPHRSWLRKR
jgi:hypothetical protein